MSLTAQEPVAAPAAVVSRRITRVDRTPAPKPGFIGEGHTAVEVLTSKALSESDPFVLLMDDRLDMAERRVIGGPHPHAGLETVTLVLEGSVYDREEGALSAADAVWMTAGRGVVHNEHVEAEGRVRILQLWIGLPESARYAAPALQVLRANDVPVRREGGATVRLYSGRSGTLRSATKSLVAVTLAEVVLESGAQLDFELPAAHTGFVYVISGEVALGADERPVRSGEVAWLDRPAAPGSSTLAFTATSAGARAVVYAGEPHGERLVQHGPFVGDSEQTITEFFLDYRSGGFRRVSELGQDS
jgi:redox-sensitive bicupin YhaK (pirin superfamily)